MPGVSLAAGAFGGAFLVALGMAASLTLTPWALASMVVAFAVAARAAASWRGAVATTSPMAREAQDGGPLQPPLDARLCYGALALLALADPAGPPADEGAGAYRVAVAAGSLVCAAMLWLHARGDRRARRAALLAVLLIKGLLVVVAPLAVPRPPIDVWQLHQYATSYLLHGQNPYTTIVPDIHQGHAAYGYQAYYPYPPLNLLLSLPARALLGDYRYGLVAALVGAVALLRAAGRRLGVPSRAVDLATFLVVLDPRLERLVVHGWTEPYLMLALAAVVYLEARRPGSPAVLVGLVAMPLLKQYFAAPLVLYLWRLRPPRRSLLLVGGLGILLVVPAGLLWAPQLRTALEQGFVYFLQRTQFRPDSVSLVAALHPLTGYTPTPLTAIAAQGVCGLLAGLALRGAGLGGWLLASAIALLGSFLFAPQAFVNYYAFVAFVLALAFLCAHRAPTPAAAARPAVLLADEA